ncbi:unnamed protein product [Meganyctiphanes norvegica]|uniref:Cuticle protein n=1 Tax=Meganyctiphanes norvegica TaxID=48144 RepID=A0AAV2SNM4_MEGNR
MKAVVMCMVIGVACAAKLGRQESHLKEEPSSTHAPQPYNFGFEVRDDDTTNYQNRAEVQDAEGRIKGSYSYVLPDGFVYTVTYEDKKDGNGLVQTVQKAPSGIEVVTPKPYAPPKKSVSQKRI